MRHGSLRQRLAWALAATGAVTALLLGFSFWVSEEAIEDAALLRLMRSELELVRGVSAGQPELQRLYRPSHGLLPPEAWTPLPPGSFLKVEIDGRPYQLLVEDVAPGDRIYLAQSLQIGQQREHWLLLALAFAVATSALLAFAVSGRLSRLSLQPLQTLLERVRGLQPEQRGQRLAPAADTPELDIIIHALNDYMQALDRLVARERAFAGAAAHELQTPVAVIAGAAELLAARHENDPAPARIQRAGLEASRMLDMLLALSETREAPPSADLLLADELPRLAQQCPTRAGVEVQWHLPADVRLRAPPAAVSLIFVNLLRNALRAASSRVEVSLSSGGLIIRDDGHGIAPELMPQVFEPGVRGSEGGSGLGLHIARSVAQRLGWQLSLANADGGGAVAEWRWA